LILLELSHRTAYDVLFLFSVIWKYRLVTNFSNPLLHQAPFDSYESSALVAYESISDVRKLPGLFDDSSCQVWAFKGQLPFDEGCSDFILKSHSATTVTPFWRGMQLMFGLSVREAYQNAPESYAYLSKVCSLQTPKVLDVLSSQYSSALVLEKIAGESVNPVDVTNQIITQLAEYLARLHQQSVTSLGALNSNSAAKQTHVLSFWQQRLKQTVMSLAETNYSQNKYVLEALDKIKEVNYQKLVPLMMDLRWDQFAQQKGVLTGVFDLDAYVKAPIELDFVILEYLLTEPQLEIFVEAYNRANANEALIIPSLENVRFVYRMVFFLMNALGETDIDKWMSHPTFFKD